MDDMLYSGETGVQIQIMKMEYYPETRHVLCSCFRFHEKILVKAGILIAILVGKQKNEKKLWHSMGIMFLYSWDI